MAHPRAHVTAGALAAATLLGLGGVAAAQGELALPPEMDTPTGGAATVESQPPGPAGMAFTHGTQTEVDTDLRPLVMAAGEDTFRRVREAESRSSRFDRGAPAPMLLSPDGAVVAVGASGQDGTVAFLDLETGELTESGLDRVNATLPSAWDETNGYLWVRARYSYDNDSGSVTHDDWEWHRIDLETGRAERLPALSRVLNIAPIHGSEHLLVRHNTARAQIYRADDLSRVGDSFALSGTVEGWAVSPDGGRFAVAGGGEVRVHDLADPDVVTLEQDAPEDTRLQGWVDDDTVLISWADADAWVLETLDLGSGERAPVTRQELGTDAQLGGVSVATGLLDTLRSREAREVDVGGVLARVGGGPLILGGLLAAGLPLGAYLVWRRRPAEPVSHRITSEGVRPR